MVMSWLEDDKAVIGFICPSYQLTCIGFAFLLTFKLNYGIMLNSDFLFIKDIVCLHNNVYLYSYAE